MKPTPILGSHAFTAQAKSTLCRAQQAQLPLPGRSSPPAASNGLSVLAAQVPVVPPAASTLPMPPTFHGPSPVVGPGGLPMPPNYHPPVAASTSTLPVAPSYVASSSPPVAPVVGPTGLPMPPNYVPPNSSTTGLPVPPTVRGPSGYPMPPGYRPPAAPAVAAVPTAPVAPTVPAVPTAPPQAPSGSNAVRFCLSRLLSGTKY